MSESDFKRAHRVGQLLQQTLGDLLVNEIKDPRVGFVTVTEVRPSDDLRTARVYVSIYGDEPTRKESLAGLEEAAGFIKRELARRVNLRYTPSLTFVLDRTLDQAERLDQLIAEAKRGARDPAAEDQSGEGLAIVPVETARTDLAASAEALEPPPRKVGANRSRRTRVKRGRPGRQRNKG